MDSAGIDEVRNTCERLVRWRSLQIPGSVFLYSSFLLFPKPYRLIGCIVVGLIWFSVAVFVGLKVKKMQKVVDDLFANRDPRRFLYFRLGSGVSEKDEFFESELMPAVEDAMAHGFVPDEGTTKFLSKVIGRDHSDSKYVEFSVAELEVLFRFLMLGKMTEGDRAAIRKREQLRVVPGFEAITRVG
jgi:hypothetical protein